MSSRKDPLEAAKAPDPLAAQQAPPAAPSGMLAASGAHVPPVVPSAPAQTLPEAPAPPAPAAPPEPIKPAGGAANLRLGNGFMKKAAPPPPVATVKRYRVEADTEITLNSRPVMLRKGKVISTIIDARILESCRAYNVPLTELPA